MKLKVGDRYKISDKLKNAFGVIDTDAKIISISAGIVILQIGGSAFPLKENIAANNLFTTYTLSAQFTEKEVIDEPIIDEPVDEVVDPIIEPEEEIVVVVDEPVNIPEQEVDVVQEDDVQPEDGNGEAEVEEDIEVITETPVPIIDIDNSISITPVKKVVKEVEVIEPEVQDNIEIETVIVEPEYEEEFNPDDEWGM